MKNRKPSIMIRIFFMGFLFVCILFSHSLIINAQTKINKVKIIDSVSVIIYCNESNPAFSSKLSDAKNKIIISFPNTLYDDPIREYHQKGTIEDIYIQNKDNILNILLLINDKVGYTAVPLPCSKAILIDVFKWDLLNPAEDNYRSGLLALEDKLFMPAIEYLEQSAKDGHTDAKAFLGITQLRQGKLKSAANNLLLSYHANTKIADVYAALSQLFRMNEIYDRANYYANLFTEKSGLSAFAEIPFSEIAENDSLDRTSLLELEKQLALLDKKNNEILAENDSTEKKFKDIFEEDKKEAVADENIATNLFKSLFPVWFFDFFIYFLIIAVLLILIILFSYLKWRKKQINSDKIIDISQKPDFKNNLDNAANNLAVSRHAAKLYKETEAKNSNIISQTKSKTIADNIDNKNPNSNISEDKDINKLEKNSTTDSDSKDEDFKDYVDFDRKVDNIAKQLLAAQKQKTHEAYESELEEEDKKKIQSMNAKMKLAFHLQEEQKKFKVDNISNLEDDKLPNDDNKLKELARKKHIDMDSLEAKRNISELETNKEILDKLEKKFSKKNK